MPLPATFFYTKRHPNSPLFRYNYIKRGYTLPSSCLRRAFAPKGEARCIQNGVKKSPSSPIHLADEPHFKGTSINHLEDEISTILKKCKSEKKTHKPFVRTCETLSAEREGFEPPDPRRSTVFKTAAFDRSAIFPIGIH